jgi:Domain of unknown function (DUF4232)
MISATHSVRQAVGGAALAGAVVALLTACGHSGPASPPAKTITITAGPSTPSGSAAPAAEPTPAPTAQAGPGPCPTRSLQAKAGAGQGTAGSTFQAIDFTNIGKVTCTLYGYPGVSLAGGSPVKQIGLAAAESKTAARTLVTLKPGAVANAVLQIVDAENYPPAKCGLATATYLQIYPPNQTTAIYLSYNAKACSKPVQTLTVTVVQAGAGSSQ